MRTSVLIFLLFGLVRPVLGQDFEGTVHWTVRFEDRRPEPKEPNSKAVEDRERANLEGLKEFFPKSVTLSVKNGNSRFAHQGGPLDGNVVLRLAGRPGHLLFNANTRGIAGVHPPLVPTPAAIARCKITRTDETGSILGLPTRKYAVVVQSLNSEMTIAVWATTALPGADAAALMYLQLSDGEAVYLPRIEGLPLKLEYRGPAAKGLEFILEADRIDRLPLADDLFRIPAGYTEKIVEPQPLLVRPRAGTAP